MRRASSLLCRLYVDDHIPVHVGQQTMMIGMVEANEDNIGILHSFKTSWRFALAVLRYVHRNRAAGPSQTVFWLP